MRELALRVVGKVLLLVAPGFLADEVAMAVPGKALVFVDQQPVAGPGAGRAIGDARALVAQQIEVGVGQAAFDGLGPVVFFALALAAAVAVDALPAALLAAAAALFAATVARERRKVVSPSARCSHISPRAIFCSL